VETVHGFPVLIAGPRFSVVEMPDCWAIMDSLDPFPRAVFRYQKDGDGWREAAAQLQRSNAPAVPGPPVRPTTGAVRARRPRRQFSLPRIGIFFNAALLGASAYLPWAVIAVPASGNGPASTVHGTLFQVMFHGWRKGLATGFVVLAVFCALQSVLFAFSRIKLVAFLVGVVGAGLTVIGITQVHTFTGGVSQPSVTVGYGAYVALGSCGLLVLSWAIFPSRMRTRSRLPVDPLGEYGTVNAFPGTDDFAGGAGVPSGGGAAGQTFPRGATRAVPAQPGGPAHFSDLPSLGAALGDLARLAPPRAADPPAGAGPAASVGATPPADAPPQPPAVHPPGWYPDYADPRCQRYWDGRGWTAHTAPR